MGEHRRRRRPGPQAGGPQASGPRVGLLGLFGQGNLGNDGSLEAMLAYLRERHPDAVLDVRCTEPDLVSARYGVPADRLRWYRPEEHPATGPASRARKALGIGLGLGIDAIRTARWVRRHDVVIVPGMGVLEATLPLRPWHLPYLMYRLGRSGRRYGTRIALVSVGSNVIRQRVTRMLVTSAARGAHYRSFRDTRARDALREMGVDTSRDPVYPDLAFSLPVPAGVPRVRWARSPSAWPVPARCLEPSPCPCTWPCRRKVPGRAPSTLRSHAPQARSRPGVSGFTGAPAGIIPADAPVRPGDPAAHLASPVGPTRPAHRASPVTPGCGLCLRWSGIRAIC